MSAISIMIVEGNPSFLRVESFLFQKHCHPEMVVVGTAVRGDEALAQARVLRPDAILFDLAVCGCGGPAMIALLKRALPETAIIARGSPNEEIDREALLAAGIDDVVSKFASPTELLPVIKRVWENRLNRRAQESAAVFHSLKHRALNEPTMKKHGKPITILMADDEATDCLLVKTAVERAHLHNPRPGLILLDLNMPRKDGREALAEIKADSDLSKIPVVVLTGSKADEDFWRARNLGADMYLVKPVTFETLVNVTRSLGKYWFEIVEIPHDSESTPARPQENVVRVA